MILRRSREGKEDIKNDYSFVAEGSKITKELSDFLKGTHISNIAYYHKIKAGKVRVHYKKKTSNYTTWEQKEHVEDYLLHPENVKENLSIDEVSLSQGELYTFVTNKSHNRRKGSLVGCIKGPKSEDIMRVLNKLPKETRSTVKEIKLDMAPNMALASKKCFENAALTTDRFHVVKLVNEAMQHLACKTKRKA